MRTTRYTIVTVTRVSAIILSASMISAVYAQAIPAFPGAEGYGSVALGGRGGKVITVTNLNDSGPGSLRAAVETEGPRIVVFRVSGTIELKSPLSIRNPYITIAGQTAPGDGICLRSYMLFISADDVIIRYIRCRLGDETGRDSDAIGGRGHKNIILDHVSASWSVDETMSIYGCENVTIQWCMISESLYESNHVKGNHGYGGIWGGNHNTYHHNLLAHHSSRNPRFASNCGHTDFRNNVVFNWGYNSSYGGEADSGDQVKSSVINMVGNYYKPGPATVPGKARHRIMGPSSHRGLEGYAQLYVADNVVEGYPVVTSDNWAGGMQWKHPDTRAEPPNGADVTALRLAEAWESMPIRTQSAEEAYRCVLEDAGATLPKRDSVDARIVEEVRTGKLKFEGPTYEKEWDVTDASVMCGIIDSQTDVGGWPELKSLPAPVDSDDDGMPDDWESKFGLDPKDANDNAQDKDKDGYTNIEEYLNGTDPTVFVDYTKPENNINTLS